METEDEEDLNRISMLSDQDANAAARDLKENLRGLRACYNMLKNHGNSLQHAISSFETHPTNLSEEQLTERLESLNARAMLFGISARAMLQRSAVYLQSAETDSHRVFKMLQFERERTRALEKMFLDIAKQQTVLERKSLGVSMFIKNSSLSKTQVLNLSDEDDSKENADNLNETRNGKEPESEAELLPEISQVDSLHIIRKSVWFYKKKSKNTKKLALYQNQSPIVAPVLVPRKSAKKRRSRVPDRPNISVNAWSLLKNSIGKDLSKIPMPVNFNEPLSWLQRMTEEMEYAELLDAAANIEDKCEQIAYVAAFAVSSYASTTDRTLKPFNPILGETYECDRTEDLGWRSIAEQVSHHPPITALHCEGSDWTCGQEMSVKIKFKGKNLQIVPSGSIFCKFKNGNTYTWNKVITIVNNIIIGKMWLDQQGEVEIKGLNTAAGINCKLTFVPFSHFSRETQRRVKGIVTNASNEPKYAIQGNWDSHIEIAPINSEVKDSEPERNSFHVIWTRRMPDPGSEKYHHFSKFTCELNELEEGVPPTDSRLRPDLRLMEQGLWDESNVEKLRIEEKQRLKRSRHSQTESDTRKTLDPIEPHEPLWFTRKLENDKIVHVYKGTYWEAKLKRDWSRCPDIF